MRYIFFSRSQNIVLSQNVLSSALGTAMVNLLTYSMIKNSCAMLAITDIIIMYYLKMYTLESERICVCKGKEFCLNSVKENVPLFS